MHCEIPDKRALQSTGAPLGWSGRDHRLAFLQPHFYIGHIIIIIVGIKGVGKGGGGCGRVKSWQEARGCLQVPTTWIRGETDDGENHNNIINNPGNHPNHNRDQGEGDVDCGRDPAPHLPRLLLLSRLHPLHRLWGGQLAGFSYLGWCISCGIVYLVFGMVYLVFRMVYLVFGMGYFEFGMECLEFGMVYLALISFHRHHCSSHVLAVHCHINSREDDKLSKSDMVRPDHGFRFGK